MLHLLKRWCGALALAVSLCCLVPSAAHAGTKHWDTMTSYLEATKLTLASARKIKEGTTFSASGITCTVKKKYTISHCIEDHLLAEQRKAKVAADSAANQRSHKGAKIAPQPEQKAVSPRGADKQISGEKVRTPFITDKTKIDVFWPLMVAMLIFLCLFLVFAFRRRRRW